MRETQTTPELQKCINYNGGKDPNYLVRSRASRLGTITQGHKVPKSDYRSMWLQRLNRVELMQNVEVQLTLRKMMSMLKAGDEMTQVSNSAHEFMEKRRIEKCHKAVCKIRESELGKSFAKPLTHGNNDFKSKPLNEGPTVNKASLPVHNTSKKSNFNDNEVHYDNKFYYNNDNNNNNNNFFKSKIYNSNTQVERTGSLPPIPEATQEKNTFHRSRRGRVHHSSLPDLDAASKFNIIKRAREIRIERNAGVENQSLSTISSQVERKFSKARKESTKNTCKIEIFADNHKILSDEAKVVADNKPVTLPLLDSKSFSEIDCNDYLNIKNRLDGLSPVRAVLDHKLHWPARTSHK